MHKAYLYFAPEKELLNELIKKHIEFAKIEERESEDSDCEEDDEKY